MITRMRIWSHPLPLIILAVMTASLLSGCIGTRVELSERGIHPGLYATRYNDVMRLGPCGMPWNYSRVYFIGIHNRTGVLHMGEFDAELTLDHTFKVIDGTMTIDADKQHCDIELITARTGEDGVAVQGPCEINGRHSIEMAPVGGQ